jgi:hypothetical protein
VTHAIGTIALKDDIIAVCLPRAEG